MSDYSKIWHRDYAAETIKRYESDRWLSEKADFNFATYLMTCAQGVELAASVGREIGNDKIVSIAQTVLDTINGSNKYRKITPAQQKALAVALVEKFGTARQIAAEIWGLTPAEIDAADA
ncbi:MAG: hypothetical protein LCI02_04980 [Proteobacteria bacterium]|nr:hypothetical protein [Pseudomonadota bacterium]